MSIQAIKKQGPLPDWNAMADKFSVWLPQLAPASEVIIDAVDGLRQKKPIHSILDIATGIGEPALSLAQRYKNISVLAIDVAEGMVNAAQSRVKSRHQDNALSAVMSAESLATVSNSFDVCASRFGIMLLNNIGQGLSEIYRVLKNKGHLIATVWSHAERMPTLQWAYQAFLGIIPDEALPPLQRATCLGDKVVLREKLVDAGFTNVHSEEYELNYRFNSFEAYWHCIEQSGIMQPQFIHLPAHKHLAIKESIACMAEDFMSQEGLIVPHSYTCVQAQKKG